MAQHSESRKLDQYIVRFPDGLRDKLKFQAGINNRSLNAEIVARLEASFADAGQALLDAADTAAALKQSLQERIERLDKMALEQEIEIKKFREQQQRMFKEREEARIREATERAEYQLQLMKERPAERERERRAKEAEKLRLEARLAAMRKELEDRGKKLDAALKRTEEREAQLVESIRKLSEIQKRR